MAYEADDLDPATRTGWSVVVTSAAGPVSDLAELARYLTQLTPWVDTEMQHVVRIRADIVTGYRLVGGDAGS
ncbi:pyridoxamine 5'-phosphate oxidase family protein [Streptomyces sp. NPDC001401]|uniref:pyridoxamine 5'-phosphate oxidase family protein n=1 Tax=Streptomyces sp. NPDC001401 TaxID=3364570 RepID=UPI0036C2558F